ncbi:glucarate transporter [Heyndrickxia ginsengihumi]|uniref:Glucarate transporter n=1 Tax=Heyndrickxia ginsengihumi TaxID=363870 RepID=A0A0A6VFF0_9BACI|nr:glucarate transporter [Heyndrickxia ginsengihumi]
MLENHKEKATRVRYSILLLIFINVVVNYMDRSNISIAAPFLSKDLHLSSVQMGLIFSAFGWAYALLQVPGGWFVDHVKPRVLYAITLGLWSVATLILGMVRGFGGLFGLRISLGVLEAPAYPTNNRIVTSWFPENERARAIGLYTSGQFVGLAFLTPVLTTIQSAFGWRGLFVVTGLVGIVWAIVWYLFYRDPRDSRRVNKAELKVISDGDGLVDWNKSGKQKSSTGVKELAFVLTKRKLWGIYIGQFCVNSTLWFFLTWFPTYLVEYRHMAFIKAGFLASLPYLAAFIGVIASGYVSDLLVKRGAALGVARKTPIIVGLLLSISIIGANFVEKPSMVILFMTLAFLGNGLASITWVFVSTLAPKNLVGLTGGVFNFIGNIASIVIPIVIGFLVKGGNFAPAIVFIAALGLIGALSYIFLVGKVKRLE